MPAFLHVFHLSSFCVLRSALLVLSFLALASCSTRRDARTVIEFWGLGREGEVVADLAREFERANPDIRVDVQQIPWTAAHEKLLTAHVGGSLPDLGQMGNTWIPEFETIGALEDLTPWLARSAAIPRSDYFDGIWETNLIGGKPYGLPWYVDTRVIFYRRDLFARVGFNEPPHSWSEWVDLCGRLQALKPTPRFFPLLMPTNEWPPPVIMAAQKGAPMISGSATALFQDPRFIAALDFYFGFFRRGDAPVLANSQIANLYQQFGEGEFAMFITGPWNVGELRRRLPAEMQDLWATAPMPPPDGQPYPGVSLAGGSSLVLFADSKNKEASWRFVEYLSRPEQQVRFYETTGDLPARKSAWNAPLLANDEKIRAFRVQLEHTVATPTIPEWEHIATTIFEQGEIGVRQNLTAAETARRLDARVNRMLEKRRWVVTR